MTVARTVLVARAVTVAEGVAVTVSVAVSVAVAVAVTVGVGRVRAAADSVESPPLSPIPTPTRRATARAGTT
ncbi:hypothetical protein [Streptomyces sp. NPDC088358]|uniref:hypothetical protein n=1 Tax=Streptomyces sp. NPDC088358 TaxID=3365857 RepID=UPI0037FD8A3E